MKNEGASISQYADILLTKIIDDPSIDVCSNDTLQMRIRYIFVFCFAFHILTQRRHAHVFRISMQQEQRCGGEIRTKRVC